MAVRKTYRRIAPLQVFTEGELERLQSSSLELLRRTGVKVTLPAAVELLRKAGCWIDGSRVRIPPHLVEWAIRTAPKRVVLADREGNPALFLEGYNSYFGTGSDCIFVIDPYSGQRREAVLKDVGDFAKLVDSLPNMDFNMGMSVAQDVPEQQADIRQFYAMVSNTTKPVVFATWGPQNLRVIVEMAEAIAGGAEALQRNPFMVLFGCPVSPLQHTDGPTESLLFMAEKGLPYVTAPSALAGGTAPITLAGAMVQINAEMLAGLLMAQLQREGAPYITFAGCPNPMDMRTMIASYGSPEFLLFQIGLTQLQHYLDLPTFGTAGCTDAKLFDQQASLEGARSVMIAALCGSNLVHDLGYVEYGSTSSFEMVAVMDNMVGEMRFILQGMQIDEETLALDVLDQVGPGGEFVTSDHTFRHFREGCVPGLIGDRHTHDSWAAKGSKTLGERANERVREILESHKPKPMPDEIKAKVRAIMAAAGVE